MALPPDAMPLYSLTTALFQGLVAVLILAAARRDPAHRAFALLFGLNALIALSLESFLGQPLGLFLGARLLDTFTGLLLVYLMAQFPAPPGDPRARRALRWGLAVASAAWVAAFAAGGMDPAANVPLIHSLLHTGPLVLAGGLVFLRVVPGYLRLDRGPLQTQTLLVAAAFGMHFLRLGLAPIAQGVAAVAGLSERSPQSLSTLVDMAAYAVLAMYGGYAVARLLGAARRDLGNRPRHLVLAAFLLAGAATVLADRVMEPLLGSNASFSDVSLLVVRPLLVAYAMARFDLFAAPAAARRFLPAATGLAFLVMSFLVALRALSLLPEPFGPDRAATALGALLACAALAGLGLAVAPRLGLTRGADPDRIEAYRLALEKARLEPPTPEREARLAALRRRLGIREEEHDLLALMLERHVFVPAGSIAALQAGQVLAGKYEVVRELGRGGFGRALLARDREGAGLVVVKELLAPWVDDAAGHRAALGREFEAARGVESVHVARSLALLEDGPQLRLVREYVPGRTLREVVEERGALPPREAARTIADVLCGLEALHARGVLHLDLKPENVVLDERGRAVLIDFGAARAARALGGATVGAPTLSQPRAGTLAWMAPEQVLGKSIDERTDLYQAGTLLDYLLRGVARVNEAASSYEVERALVEGTPAPLPRRVPPRLRAAVGRATAREPSLRGSIAALRRDIAPSTS